MEKKRTTIVTDIVSANWGMVKQQRYQVIILPWGAMEPHNYHLPYLTDCILSYEIARDCAKAALKQGVKCMVLPPIYMGSQNIGQWNKPFCVHARSETQKAILLDMITSFYGQGFRNMVIINGHGGNTFKSYIRDFAVQFPDFRVVAVDWYGIVPKEGYFEADIDEHAGEHETSVMLHYHPEWVDMDGAGMGEVSSCGVVAVDQKIGWMPRNWDLVSKDTGIGNPSRATAEKGARYVTAVVEKVVELLVELGEQSEMKNVSNKPADGNQLQPLSRG